MPQFDEIVFHPNFEGHQVEAGRRLVTRNETEEAWCGSRRMVPNRKGRRAPYLMLGSTLAGRDITVVVLPTKERGTWLAYTAWDTKNSDQ